MFFRYLSHSLVLLMALGVCAGATATEPKRDRYGDPLPEGAVARLGSMRLRTEKQIFNRAFTSDGKTFIVREGNSFSSWDLATGKLRRRLELKNAAQVERLYWMDGKTLVLSRRDKPNVLYFMDPVSGAEQHTLNHVQRGNIGSLRLSHDGKMVVTFNFNNRLSIALWDVPGGKLLHEFKEPRIGPRWFGQLTDVTADGKQLVLRHSDNSLHLADAASGKEIHAFEMPPLRPGFQPFQRLEYWELSPDDRYLAFGGLATPLTVCELATGKRLHELAPPPNGVFTLAFTPNSRFLAIAEYTRIRLFGVLSGKELCQLSRTPATTGRVVFSPDGQTLADVRNYTINLWNVAGRRPLHPPVGHEESVQSMVFFPDGKRLVSADYVSGPIVWDIASGRILAQRRNKIYEKSLAVDGDGQGVRFVGADDAVHRWHPRTGREESQTVFAGLTRRSALSPDGRSLAVLTSDDRLQLYDLKNNKSKVLLRLPWPRLRQLTFAPGSRRLAACSDEGALWLWDRDTGQLLHEFKKETSAEPPSHLAFAADGRSLALADDKVRIRDIASGTDRLQIPIKEIAVKEGPWGESSVAAWLGIVDALAYSPDARLLACSQSDGRIVVYSAVTGKQLTQWQGNQNGVRCLTFSRDSRLLASGGENRTILIWKVPKDKALPVDLTAEKAVALWQTLGDRDAAIANRPLAALTAAPARTLPLFKEHLRPIGQPLDRQRLARLIAELDDDSFQVRERATRELALIGADAADALHQALHNDPSAEVKRRIDDLLARLKKGGDSERLRFLRAVEVLERIGTPQARELLRELAGKPMASELGAEVQASLRRMGEQP